MPKLISIIDKITHKFQKFSTEILLILDYFTVNRGGESLDII